MTQGNDIKKKIPKAGYNLFDDCERPACDEMTSMLHQAAASSDPSVSKQACPPSKSFLGQSSWALLHTMVGKILRDYNNFLIY